MNGATLMYAIGVCAAVEGSYRERSETEDNERASEDLAASHGAQECRRRLQVQLDVLLRTEVRA